MGKVGMELRDEKDEVTSWSLVPASAATSGHAHPTSLAIRWLRSKRRLPLVPSRLAGTPDRQLLSAGVGLGSSVGDVHGDALDNVILAAERLRHLEKRFRLKS